MNDDELTFLPDPQNINRGTPRGHGIIERSVRQRGAGRSGLAARDGTILAGNQTLIKMAELGIPIRAVHTTGDEWVVVVRDDLDPESEDARLLALEDNRASEVGYDPDPALLAALAQEVDLSGLYYDDELAALLASVAVEPGAGGDEFDTTPQDGPTRTALNELWAIGPHRLLVGDCTDAANVARLMDGGRADILINDPPYGMRLDASYANSDINSRLSIQKSRGYASVTGDHEDYDPTPIMALFQDVKEQFWWGADYYRQYLPAGGSWLAWDKRANMTEFDYTLSEFELCWSRAAHHRKILRVQWFGAFGTQTQDVRHRVHPTQKPLEVYTEIMERHSKAGALVVDTYLGSGTTLIAAHRTGRRCYGMEIEPRYADVILRRAEAEGLSCSRLD